MFEHSQINNQKEELNGIDLNYTLQPKDPYVKGDKAEGTRAFLKNSMNTNDTMMFMTTASKAHQLGQYSIPVK